MDNTQQPAAGWYPAAHADGEQRYWDGKSWHSATPHDAWTAAQTVPRRSEEPTQSHPLATAPRRKGGLRWWAWTAIAAGAVLLVVIGAGLGNARTANPASAEVAAPTPLTESPTPTADTATVTVPATLDLIAKEARALLENENLQVSFSADKGVVIDQDNWTVVRTVPAAGEQVRAGSTVVVSVVKTAELTAPTAQASPSSEAPAPPAAAPQYTLSQQNAIRSARSYLDYSGFSRQSLIGQLEYEQYSTEDATFAVDTVGADWNAEAAESAASYLEYSSFSRDELYGQLEYEGFTPEQIEYGLAAVGY